jgi:sortase (surface protein transpeptidase)
MSVQPAIPPAVELTVHRPLAEPTALSPVQPMITRPLTDPGLDLRAGPVDVPLELRIPSLRINAPIVGVGITAENVMDAPKGLAADPVWQKVFWYRGGGIPGDPGTATIAGHVDDVLGRPAAFARLRELRPGDLIVVHDTRSGLDVRFTVVKTATYSAQQAADPAVLAQVYGSGPVSGKGPLPAADGLAHLTLITCAGGFVNGSYDQRLIVYATRSESTPLLFRWKHQACATSTDGPSSCWF